MTDTDEPTAPMRPAALHDDAGQLSRTDALHYANVIVNSPPDPNRAGTVRLAWALIRLDQQHTRLEVRVANLIVPDEDLVALMDLRDHIGPGNCRDALTRLIEAHRED